MRRTRLALRSAWIAGAFALLLAAPAPAYTIHLKDGSTVVAKEKYKVDGDKAIIVLMNGTETFVPLAKIDVAKTDRANEKDYGSAVVIDRAAAPQAQALPSESQRRLSDLIASRTAAEPRAKAASRDQPAAPADASAKTRAGYLDLTKVPRRPVLDEQAASELLAFLRGQGIDEVELFEGSQRDRLLVEVTTNSEASVFRALTVAANGLLHVRGLPGNKVAAFELLLTTPSRERAGQFLLTPALAEELVAKRVEVASFFVANVQF